MIMIDNTKAALIGTREKIISEVAFLMDKLCSEATSIQGTTYDDTKEMLLREVDKLKKERESGNGRDHPHHPHQSNSSNSSELKKSDEKTPAEIALEEALKKIDRLKKEKGEKKKGKKKNKDKKGKKDTK